MCHQLPEAASAGLGGTRSCRWRGYRAGEGLAEAVDLSGTIARASAHPPMAGAASSQRVHVTVGWSRDADGNLKPFVEKVAQEQSVRTVKAYDRSMPLRLGQHLNAGRRNGTIR